MISGIYSNLSNEEYHGHKGSISRSGIMDFAKCPYEYWSKHINPERPEKKSSVQMDFGTAFHMIVLEPEKFADLYRVEPLKVWLKQGRDVYEAYKKEMEDLKAENKIIISFEEYQVLLRMRERFRNHPDVFELLFNGTYEQSYFWNDPESGLLIKARPDVLNHNCYIDIKTCLSATSHSYQRSLLEGGYHIQAAMVMDAVWQLEGRKLDACINICIEKTYPYHIGIKIITDEAILAGRRKYQKILLDMKKCFETNEWPSYLPETVGLPAWAT